MKRRYITIIEEFALAYLGEKVSIQKQLADFVLRRLEMTDRGKTLVFTIYIQCVLLFLAGAPVFCKCLWKFFGCLSLKGSW